MWKYEKPNMEIMIFEENVIVTSPGITPGGSNGWEDEEDFENFT